MTASAGGSILSRNSGLVSQLYYYHRFLSVYSPVKSHSWAYSI
jgi:hypothetical protein